MHSPTQPPRSQISSPVYHFDVRLFLVFDLLEIMSAITWNSRHTQEERERGGGGGDQVSACPSAHHKSSHTHDFLLSLTLGQPRSSPGDFCSIYRWGKITGSHQASNLLLFFWFQILSPRFILILFCFLTDFKLGNLKLRE